MRSKVAGPKDDNASLLGNPLSRYSLFVTSEEPGRPEFVLAWGIAYISHPADHFNTL